MTTPRVADLLAHLESVLPTAWAEPWDRVGLLVGDPSAQLRRVLVSLDPTPDALARAVAAGADVLLTHHPAFLDVPATTPSAGLRGVSYAAAAAGVALVAAHTNLDRAPAGADALAYALDLEMRGPLERSRQPVAVIVTYVDPGAAEAVRGALAAAGAGRIGLYAGCSFSSEGTGRYTPLAGSSPVRGTPGEPARADEVRVEVVCAPDRADAVVQAVRAVHPYEEPVVAVCQGSVDRGAARMGRVCEVPAGVSLQTLATGVVAALGVRPTVWGDPSSVITTVALAPGSGRSLVDDAISAGCDAIVTGELRYHEALEAAASGLAVIEAGHDATEWPLTRVLAGIARETPGLRDSDVVLDEPGTHWWTAEGS